MSKVGESIEVSVDQLLLDPNNYRFLNMTDYVQAQESRYHEATVQTHAFDMIKKDGLEDLKALKNSIKTNGYLPLDTLVVREYKYSNGGNKEYIVIEGNRRVAAMKWIKEDYARGVDVEDSVLESFNNISVVKIEANSDEEKIFQLVLMGVRHVSGIKEWGGYQRAKVILEMVDDFDHDIQEAAEKLNMTTHEAMRRYRAIKALKQMQQDDEFGPSATPDMYRLFHEAISVRKIKDWLNWEDEPEYAFKNDNELKEFYKMLVPYIPEDEDEDNIEPDDPKITTYKDVRNLREILGNEDAEEALFDPDQSFSEALAIAKASEGTKWLPKVKSAISAMERITIEELKDLDEEKIEPLKKLGNLLDERLKDWKKLSEL